VTDEDLIRLVDANLVEYGRFMARATPGGASEEHDGVLLVSGTTPTPAIVNSAFMAVAAVDPAAVLPAAATFFRTRGHGYGIWTRGHLDAALDAVLPDAGFEIAIELPVMVLGGRPQERPGPPGAIVDPVVDDETAADFRSVALDGFAEDADERSAVESKFGDPAGLREPEIAAFVARVDGRPVAAAMTFAALGVARVGWAGTLPAYRRRGLGIAVTRAAVLGGFARGARWAALESSAMGAPVYRALGFREVSRYRVWVGRQR
jgi:ribosomal protein S18 acetylase RimI-like enzyme